MNPIPLIAQNRFVLLNLLFGLYLWLVQPGLLARMHQPALTGQPQMQIGWLLLLVQGFELIGLYLKGPVTAYYVSQSSSQNGKGSWSAILRTCTLVLAPIFHIGFSSILALVAFDMLSPHAVNKMGFLPVGLIFLVIIKETVFIGFLLAIYLGSLLTLPEQTSELEVRLRRMFFPRVIHQISSGEAARDLAGDFFLLVFSALAFTAAWDFLTISSPLRAGISGMFTQYLGVSFLYWMVYIGTRSIYLMQEVSTIRNRWNQLLSMASIILSWIAALWCLPVR